MSTDFSLRQLLACLNISVFDPLVEPSLKKACQIDAEQKAEKKNPFHSVFSLIVLQIAALLCFYGFRSHSFSAGLFFVLFGGMFLYKTTSQGYHYFFKIYFLAGLLLWGEKLFLFSPFLVAVLLLFFLLRNLTNPKARDNRVLSALWFFGVVVWTVFLFYPEFFSWTLCFFSLLGVLGLLFPLKNIYFREASVIFSVMPLFLLLVSELFCLEQKTFFCSRNEFLIAFTFFAEFFLLFFCLRTDLETNETFSFLFADFLLFLTGLFLSNGLSGTITLFTIAFFTDARDLGRSAIILFSCFLLTFFLSLPLSFLTAGWVCSFSGLVFALFYIRLKRFCLQENK